MNASEKDELYTVRQGNPDRIILVVDHHNILAVSYLALTGIDWMERSIGNFVFRIHPEWCNQGLGTSVLCTVCQWVFKRGIRKVRLDVVASNARAIRCYEKVGLRSVGEMWQDAPDLKEIDTSLSRYDFLRAHLRQENEIPH